MTDLVEKYFALSDYEPKSMLSGMVLALFLKKLSLDVKIYRLKKAQEEQVFIFEILEKLKVIEADFKIMATQEKKLVGNKIKQKITECNGIIEQLLLTINGREEIKKITEEKTKITDQLEKIINILKVKKEEITQKNPQNYKIPRINFVTENDFKKINFNEQTENRVYYFVFDGSHFYTAMFEKGETSYKIISTESMNDVLDNENEDRLKNLNIAAEGCICETKAFMDIVLFERCLIFNENCQKAEDKIILLNKIGFNSKKSGKDIKFDGLDTFRDIYERYEKKNLNNYFCNDLKSGFQYPMIKRIIEIFTETSQFSLDDKYQNLKKIFGYYNNFDMNSATSQQSLGQWVLNVLNEELSEENQDLEQILAENTALELFEGEKGKQLFPIVLEILNKEKNIKKYFEQVKGFDIGALNSFIQAIKELKLPNNEEIWFNRAVICNFNPLSLLDLEAVLDIIKKSKLMSNEERKNISKQMIFKMNVSNLKLFDLIQFIKILSASGGCGNFLNEKISQIKEIIYKCRCECIKDLDEVFKIIKKLQLTKEDKERFERNIINNVKVENLSDLKQATKILKKLKITKEEEKEFEKNTIYNFKVRNLSDLKQAVEVIKGLKLTNEEKKKLNKVVICNLQNFDVINLGQDIEMAKKLKLDNEEKDSVVKKLVIWRIEEGRILNCDNDRFLKILKNNTFLFLDDCVFELLTDFKNKNLYTFGEQYNEILDMRNAILGKNNLKKNRATDGDYDCAKQILPKSITKLKMEDHSNGDEEVKNETEENNIEELNKTSVEEINQQRSNFSDGLGII